MQKTVWIVFGLAGLAAAQGNGPFEAGCALPFAEIATAGLLIDKDCAISGKAVAKSPEGLQNLAKNNFCAKGPMVTVTPRILADLQAAVVKAKVPFGSPQKLPPSRKALTTGFTVDGAAFHEGQLVRMAGFIIESHPSDTEEGEDVNCKTKGIPANDVHIALGGAYGADECASVTAEISPHSRPAGWEVVHRVQAKDKTSKPAPITRFPIRVEGQLFFDASHTPCAAGKPTAGDPARQSLWEIHPVYHVDVCKNSTLAACPVDKDAVWTPLQVWKPPVD